MSIPDVAEALGVPVTRIHQYLRDGHLVEARDENGKQRIPSDLVHNGEIVKSLRGVITVLRDAHYADAEILDWLYRADESLPGTPIQALRENRGSEVKRRAMVAGY